MSTRLICALSLCVCAAGLATEVPAATKVQRRRASSTTVSSTAPSTSTGSVTVTGSTLSRTNAYRYKLAQAVCPTADATPFEKELLACKNYEISHKMKGASEELKKTLGEARKALYTAAAAKPAEEKKKGAAAHKVFYTKAYAKYCATHATTDTCTNEVMKKMYSGERRKRVKKAM